MGKRRPGGPELLPPHSPEPDPIERLWASMRCHDLGSRAYDEDDQYLLAAGPYTWRERTPEMLRSICACDRLPGAPESTRVIRMTCCYDYPVAAADARGDPGTAVAVKYGIPRVTGGIPNGRTRDEDGGE